MTDAFKIKSVLGIHYQVVHLTHANNILEDVRLIMPNLILMDVVMPGISGFNATRTLKNHHETCHIPIIICSSKSIDADRVWAMRNGADEYVTKPVDNQILLSRITGILRNKGIAAA